MVKAEGSFIFLPQVVKLESGTFAPTSLKTLTSSSPQPLTSPEATELQFLHSRVLELEREKAELSAENQRLKNMLVHGESGSADPPAEQSESCVYFHCTTCNV